MAENPVTTSPAASTSPATAPTAVPEVVYPLSRPGILKPKAEPKPALVSAPKEKAAVCQPRDRAPAGWKRFKIRAEHGGGNHPPRYILAKTQADAEACYIRDSKLEDEAAIKDEKGRPVLRLITIVLPD